MDNDNLDLRDCFLDCDISPAVKEMQLYGTALLENVLQEPFRSALVQEISALPFRRAREKVGAVNVVDQAFDYCAFLMHIPGRPYLESLRRATTTVIRHAGKTLSDPGLIAWQGCDLAINRYGRSGGLSAHKDLKRHPAVIAIWNITGSCDFEVLNDRDGEIITTYHPAPRDLVLLRGTSLERGASDGRPFHRVRNIVGDKPGEPRVSVTVRDNIDSTRPLPGFSYVNA